MKTITTQDAPLFDWEEYNTFLGSPKLASRWGCSTKKIEADRLKGEGPPYIKIGRLVRYRLSEIIEYEISRRRQHTSQNETPKPDATNPLAHDDESNPDAVSVQSEGVDR